MKKISNEKMATNEGGINTKPQLLLLDEATAALDPKTERYILDLLLKVKEKMGIFLVTHKETTAKIADTVYVIEGGFSKSVSSTFSHWR